MSDSYVILNCFVFALVVYIGAKILSFFFGMQLDTSMIVVFFTLFALGFRK